MSWTGSGSWTTRKPANSVYSDMSNNRAFPWAEASFPITLNPIARIHAHVDQDCSEEQISFEADQISRSPDSQRPIHTGLFPFLFVPRERSIPRDKPGSYAPFFRWTTIILWLSPATSCRRNDDIQTIWDASLRIDKFSWLILSGLIQEER